MKAIGSTRPRILPLAVLLVMLAGTLYWRFGGTAAAPVVASKPRTATAPSAPAAPQTGGGKPAGHALPSPLHFDALDRVPTATPASRNPFRFYTPPPPPPPPRPAPVVRPPTPQGFQPVGPPPPPPITLKYVGKFQQGGKTLALLSDGKSQFTAGEGGIIDGRYRVVKIGIESLQIEYVNGKGLVTLPFKG